MVKVISYDSFLSKKEARRNSLESVAREEGFVVATYGTNSVHLKKKGYMGLYVIDSSNHCIETVLIPSRYRQQAQKYARELGKSFEQNNLGEWTILRN